MKKTIPALAAIAMLTLASCDTKECRCYEYTGTRWVRTTTSTLAGTACNSLNTDTYKCDEMSDPVIDPNDIASKKKK